MDDRLTEYDERVARIENMQADTRYKKILADWEPGKTIAVAVGATATLTLALVALATLILAHFIH
jgi:hypothetical protein